MARGINKAILVGHLGSDPEVRYLPSGGAVTNISIATTESWKDKQTGQQQESTEWHRVTFFGRLAEVAGEYLTKGSQAYIEGKIQTKKWTDSNGIDRYTTMIIAGEFQMLGSPKDKSNNASNYRPQPAPAPTQIQSRNQGQMPSPPPGIDSFDDDIQF